MFSDKSLSIAWTKILKFLSVGRRNVVSPTGRSSPYSTVNAPPPKGGGFELRLKAGLVRLRRTQVTLKSSSGSGGVWFLMYSAQTSSDNDVSSPKPDGTCSPKQYGCPVCTLPSFQSTRIMPRSHAA